MAANKDFIDILREIRGRGIPGEAYTDGIWYELTIADRNSNPGIYGDILSKYGIIVEHVDTFAQAVSILEKLNVEITTLPAGSEATSALVYGVWQLGIPRGTPGIDGLDGFTPNIAISYTLGKLNCVITVDNVQVVNTTLVNLDELVNTVVNANVDVQTTLEAKQLIIDSVEIVQEIADGLDDNVANKIIELSNHTIAKLDELNAASTAEQLEITNTANVEKLAFCQSVITKVTQYNENHVAKLAEYDANDELKIEQYNTNHTERLENLDEKYATRIIDMLNTNKILGMVDKFSATSPVVYATFIDTVNGQYLYYLNGAMLIENVDYSVINGTTIHLTNSINYGDVVTQVDSKYVVDYLTFGGVLLEERIGVPNGLAGLDENGQVLAAQLPSYVDDVIEVATKVALPTTGEVGKIYVVVTDETSNGDPSSYRWTGLVYARVSNTLSATDVKALYESNPDTNAFIDAAEILLGTGTVLTTTATTLPTAINELQEHVVNDGSDHSFINQDVKTTATPKFTGVQLTGGTGTQGTVTWNADEETLDLIQNGATLQMGQELQTHVRNSSGSSIADGKVVMATGTLGASGRITAGLYDGTADVKYVLGVATETIANGDDGKVTSFGKIRGINTSAWNEGDVLYTTTAGGLTNVVPATGVKIAVAMVITKHAVNGVIMVRVNGVDELRYEPNNTNIQAHVASTSNPHVVTAAQVGLSNVNNTSDVTKNVLSATKWTNGRTITIGSTGKSVDGSGNVSWSLAEIGAQAAGSYQPLDDTLTALAGVTTAADKVIYATGADTFATTTISSFARTVLDDADAATVRATIGAQALDADLTAIAALAGTSGLLKKTAADTWTLDTAAYTTNLGTVTGVTGTAPVVSSGGTAPAISINAATTSTAGSMSAADKTKLDGIATSANNYVHPTTDGSLHVPATGTANSGKVLTAGATAGSLSWTTVSSGTTDHTLLSNIGTRTHAQLESDIALKANIASPVFTGNVTGLGVATGTSFNSITALASVVPVAAGTAAVGTSTTVARQDHVHPAQTTITGNSATATTATTANALNTANDYTVKNITASGSVIIGQGGQFVAGSIYSDPNWGILFRAKQANPAMAEFVWMNSVGTELFRFNGTALTTNITGNASTATALVGDETNWASYRSRSVANMLGWKNFGNGHCIFDASNGTAPNGVAVNNTNPTAPWDPSHPTLMGWNGGQTYGVRVDSSRYADQLKTARTINGVSFNGSANIVVQDSTKIGAANYATSTVGGTVKMRISGTTLYITNNGTDA